MREARLKKYKVFLDLGTHGCQGLRSFIKKLSINSEWEVHTFEPNPLLQPVTCVAQFNDIDIIVHDQAIWVQEGTSVFKQYGRNGTSQGSLLEETDGDKHYHDYYSSTDVTTIDFFQFLKGFDDDQKIFIKMDIEWSEYIVIEDLLERGWPKNVRQLWIEWHGMNDQFYINKSRMLTEQIELSGCEVTSWH